MTVVWILLALCACGLSFIIGTGFGHLNQEPPATTESHEPVAFPDAQLGVLTKDHITYTGWTSFCPCGHHVSCLAADNEDEAIARWNAHVATCPALPYQEG